MALAVPLSRFTPQVGGGSAFFVRQQDHTIMKNIPTLLALIAAAVLTGCSTTPSQHAYSGPTTDIVVTVTCSNPDTRFTGSIVTDGHAVQSGGTGHATFHATGHEFVCSFKKTDPDGRISISVSEAGKEFGNSSTGEKFGGVRAEIVRSLLARSDVFTTY